MSKFDSLLPHLHFWEEGGSRNNRHRKIQFWIYIFDIAFPYDCSNHLSIKISYINTENWREYWSFFLTISRAIYEIFLRTDNLWIICLKRIDAHVFHFFCLLLQNTETKGKRSQWVVSFWTHKTVLDRLRYMSVWGTVCSTHRTHTFILLIFIICVFFQFYSPHASTSFLTKTTDGSGPLHQRDKDMFFHFLVKVINSCKTT